MANDTLPMAGLRQRIMTTIAQHPVTIITAPPGSGKTTQLPQYLLDAGERVLITQPRRLAARTVAERVAEEYGTPFGKTVGYKTAHESCQSAATRCLFVTDGLALVRELVGYGKHTVLVIDEVHEWSINIEVLVAWIRHQLKKGSAIKVVLMSATLETERLSKYFDHAPVIDVPGTLHTIEERPKGSSLEDDVESLLSEGRNVLVFQPGKNEIVKLMKDLGVRGVGNYADILPLHGELSAEEQQRCFNLGTRPKCVVSTNVAQTSVTIPGINAVVDTGVERRIETVRGVEGLHIKRISWASAEQRKGRSARTGPGVYIDWSPDHLEDDDYGPRLQFPVAEIRRTRNERTMLRLAVAGLTMQDLEFFHQPRPEELERARQTLELLGCMQRDGKVTRIGRRISQMPLAVSSGRMVIEAEKLGVLDDVLTIAAIMEQNGIVSRACDMHVAAGVRNCKCWQLLVPDEKESDPLAQLEVYKQCTKMSPAQMRAAGVFVRAFYGARDKRRHILKSLNVPPPTSTGNRTDILRSVCTGMVDLLFSWQSGHLLGRDGSSRELALESVVRTTPWVVGQPLDLHRRTNRGVKMSQLVRMVTRVDPRWLIEAAPDLCEVKEGLNPVYDWERQEVTSTTEIWFDGRLVDQQQHLDPSHPQATDLYRQAGNERQWKLWRTRPSIDVPDPGSEAFVLPDISVCTYGEDILTGDPLLAYGTVSLAERRYRDDPWFRVRWSRSLVDAEHQRNAVLTQLPAIRTQIKAMRTWQEDYDTRQQELKQAAIAKLAELKARAIELRNTVNDLLVEHKDELSDSHYDDLVALDVDDNQLPATDSALSLWIKRAEQTISTAQRFLIALAKAQESPLGDKYAALLARYGDRQ